jgi:hypothetical protein
MGSISRDRNWQSVLAEFGGPLTKGGGVTHMPPPPGQSEHQIRERGGEHSQNKPLSDEKNFKTKTRFG